VLHLVHANRQPVVVEDHATGTGGTLVYGSYVISHCCVLLAKSVVSCQFTVVSFEWLLVVGRWSLVIIMAPND
jgi:hypothetical protein